MTLLEESAELSFHGEDYSIYSAVNEQVLSVEVEQKASGRRWSADFTSKYVEEMSQKTGNFKKFSVFVNMLWSALKGNTESVFVDLLTLQDLETLRSRRAPSTVPARPLKASSENKRYLILTYAVEFDRVHYPLPLRYEERPDPKSLQRTIMRLRRELEQCRSGAVEGTPDDSLRMDKRIRELEDDNRSLRHELHTLEADYDDRLAQQRQRDRDVESLQHQLNERDVELRRLREKLAKQNLENLKLKKELREVVQTQKTSRQERTRTRTSSRSTGSSTTRANAPRPKPKSSTRVSSRSPAASARRLGRSRSPRVIASSKAASPRARFDPTAYVACKRKAEAARRLRTRSSSWGRAPSPVGSQTSNSSIRAKAGRRRSQRRSTSASSPAARASRASAAARPQPTTPTTPTPKRSTTEGEAKLLRRAKELSQNHTGALRRTSSGSLMEIRDLDERLTALQQFLKAAKGKSVK